MAFDDIPIRTGDDKFEVSWPNSLREQGVLLENLQAKWRRFALPHTLFTGFGALNGDVEIIEIPIIGVLEHVIIKHTTVFVGAGITTLKASVGVVGDLTRYLSQFDLLAAVADTTFDQEIMQELFDFGAVKSVRLQLTATGANLDQLSGGSLDIYVKDSVLPTIAS